MNKTELVEAMAEKADLPKKYALNALNAFIVSVEDAVKSGDKVSLVGFGTFEARVRAERTGKNPRTGEVLKIASYKTPAFKAGKIFKDIIN